MAAVEAQDPLRSSLDALALLSSRGLALEELLTRFPEWEVDEERSRLSPTSTVRGWETLPVRLGTS